MEGITTVILWVTVKVLTHNLCIFLMHREQIHSKGHLCYFTMKVVLFYFVKLLIENFIHAYNVYSSNLSCSHHPIQPLYLQNISLSISRDLLLMYLTCWVHLVLTVMCIGYRTIWLCIGSLSRAASLWKLTLPPLPSISCQ